MFLKYERDPDAWIRVGDDCAVAVFNDREQANLDAETVNSFGDEWGKFDHFDDDEIVRIGREYFDVLEGSDVGRNTRVLDAGCGSGRWSRFLASRVHSIEAIDPSDAVVPAVRQLKHLSNVRVTKASIDSIPFANESFDLIVCLGVLHHIPDTARALTTLTAKLRIGGTVLLYLYYNLDNRGKVYRLLFSFVDYLRRVISTLPDRLKKVACELIALFVYWPLSRLSKVLSLIGLKRLGASMPLAYYSNKQFYILRNDALDRFGTPLEHRFSREQIAAMVTSAGYTNLRFSENAPFWHLAATRSR